MGRLQLIALIIVTIASRSHGADPAQPPLTRDGTSFQRAIIVKVAEPDRSKWEMSQTLTRHPGLGFPVSWGRSELSHMGRLYHVYELRAKSGNKVIIYFDLGEDKLPLPDQAMEPTASPAYSLNSR